MTSRPAAGLIRYAQIAGVYKLDVIRVFFQPLGIGTNRVGGGPGALDKSRPRVRLLSHFQVLLRSVRYSGRQRDLSVPSMTVSAAQAHGSGRVHGRAVHRVVASYATCRPVLRFFER